MKIRMMSAATVAALLVLLSFAPGIAWSDVAPPVTHGAQLRITGIVNGQSINVAINDGDIHSGGVPNTSPCDELLTDAYVLQGGSPTGCDNGDGYEVTASNNPNETHQAPGQATVSGFTINTYYLCSGTPNSCSNGVPVSTLPPVMSTYCNTNNTVCAAPDTGFLVLTNSTGYDFTGSITLTGTSPGQGGSFCPPVGLASDSFSGTLANAASRVFALSPDSSNCGGFTPPLTQTLAPGDGHTHYIYPVGDSVETWTVTPVNNAGGELLTVTPVLVLQTADPGTVFNHGPLFPNASCVPVADFTGTGPDVCIEFQHTCDDTSASAHDCGTFVYQTAYHYNLASDVSIGIGGPSFLKADGAGCPANGFDENVFLSYVQNDPVHSSGGGGNSCFAATFDPTAAAVQSASVPGYASPFFVIKNPPAINNWEEFVFAFPPVPLIWQEFDTNNNLVTNPNFFSGGFCKPSTPLASCPANSVALQFVQVDCNTLTSLGLPAIRANAVFNAVVFNPFKPFKNTFTVAAIPRPSFDGTCQLLELVTTGNQVGVQSTHSAIFHFD